MVKKNVKTSEKSSLTVHGLLGSLSYWGTMARMVLVSVFVVFAYILNISMGSPDWRYIDGETLFMIYGLATLVVLDAGYVMAARSLVLDKVFDRWFVLLADLFIAGFFVVPSLMPLGAYSNRVRIMSLIVVLLVLSVRILIGLLYAKRKK